MSWENVFVYGTLKRGEPNHNWISSHSNGTAELVGTGQTVKRYPMVIATKYNIPFVLYHPGHGNNIVGEVYRVDEDMLRHLDVLEDHPNFYVRELDNVQLLPEGTGDSPETGAVVKCWVYFLKSFKSELLQLPYLTEYSSSGPHGLAYTERYLRERNHDHVWDIKLQHDA